MKSCCGVDFNSLDVMLKYCREHCKETAGCYSVSLDKVMLPAVPPRRIHFTNNNQPGVSYA
jgi:hypothetical protein